MVAVAFPATERQNQIIAIDACEAAFGRPLFAKTSTIEWHMAFTRSRRAVSHPRLPRRFGCAPVTSALAPIATELLRYGKRR